MIVPPKSNDIDIEQLLNDINNLKIQLPVFQRNWTWDDSRIRNILASVSLGYPMGALMQLESGNQNIKFKTKVFEGVTNTQTIEPSYLILDGQQRLTSLYRAIMSKDPVVTKSDNSQEIKRFYYLDINKCLDSNVDRYDAILSIPEDKIKKNFDKSVAIDLSTIEREFENEMFPVNIIFDIGARENWMLGYLQYYQMSKEYNDKYMQFRKTVLETIQKYRVPVITLDKTTPRDAVCKVFENVNTGGVVLTVFELVTASFATHIDPTTNNGFDLFADWKKSEKYIKQIDSTMRSDVLDGVQPTDFLTAITLYTTYKKLGVDTSCKKKDVLNLTYDDYIANKQAILDGYNLVREFLITENIFQKRDLPYASQILPLVVICAIIGSSVFNKQSTKDILKKWFWCGIMGEMYGGSTETRSANDVEDIIDLINGKQSKERTVNSAHFSSTRLLTLQTRQSAAYKGIMALLYKEQAKDFIDGTVTSLINIMNQKNPDIHHIFPEKYCIENNIPSTKYNSIVNKTPLLPASNRSIGGNAPNKYIENILKNNSNISEEMLISNIESNLVDFKLLNSNNFDEYFIDRAKKILNLIENAMGSKILDRGTENTIKEFGTSLTNNES